MRNTRTNTQPNTQPNLPWVSPRRNIVWNQANDYLSIINANIITRKIRTIEYAQSLLKTFIDKFNYEFDIIINNDNLSNLSNLMNLLIKLNINRKMVDTIWNQKSEILKDIDINTIIKKNVNDSISEESLNTFLNDVNIISLKDLEKLIKDLEKLIKDKLNTENTEIVTKIWKEINTNIYTKLTDIISKKINDIINEISETKDLIKYENMEKLWNIINDDDYIGNSIKAGLIVYNEDKIFDQMKKNKNFSTNFSIIYSTIENMTQYSIRTSNYNSRNISWPKGAIGKKDIVNNLPSEIIKKGAIREFCEETFINDLNDLNINFDSVPVVLIINHTTNFYDNITSLLTNNSDINTLNINTLNIKATIYFMIGINEINYNKLITQIELNANKESNRIKYTYIRAIIAKLANDLNNENFVNDDNLDDVTKIYEYVKSFPNLQGELKNSLTTYINDNIDNQINLNSIEALINYISVNFDKITGDSQICKDIAKDLSNKSYESSALYKHKYLKYKIKYLALKNSII